MRISLRPDDIEAYELMCEMLARHRGFPRVFLNDIEQECVIIADSKEGWVKRAVMDRDGRLKVNDLKDEPEMEIVNGRVFFVWPDQVFI